LPDLALNLFLRLGEHVELPDDKIFHKPDARLCREQAGDAENGLRLDGVVLLLALSITCRLCETKACRVSRHSFARVDRLTNAGGGKAVFFDAAPHACGDRCESAADERDSPHDKGHSRLSRHWLLCLTLMMQQGLFCGPQHQIVSYDNEFTVKWRRRFDWKQRS
jgi:hypothetical protein